MRKRSNKKTSRKSRYTTASKSRKFTKKLPSISASRRKCNKILSRKISRTIDEYKNGRFVSRAQAIAVAYSIVKNRYPKCKKFFSRK
jgi:hypothetical protein